MKPMQSKTLHRMVVGGWRIAAFSLAVAGLHGCEQAATTSDVPREASVDEPAWVDLEIDHWLPGPARERAFDPARVQLDRECRGCHVSQAREWAHSQHATAWSSTAFQRAFAIEPLPFCQGCHAAETSPHAPVPEAAAAIGVGCVTCHVDPLGPPGLAIVWSGAAGAREVGSAPHPVQRSPAFAGPQVCAGCHEFGFPDQALRDAPLAMQATISEHRASAEARLRSCADCHMPRVSDGPNEHRDHGFPAAHDVTMLRRSLRVTVERASATVVRLHLSPFEVGHAVPTGDLLRRLEVALHAIDPSGSRRILDRRWLSRRFAMRPHVTGSMLREEIADERVGARGKTVELRIPDDRAGSAALGWRVMHQRVAHASSDPRTAIVEGELEVASGDVPSFPSVEAP
jgi:hypothetical protein